jgi:hypothetical protein
MKRISETLCEQFENIHRPDVEAKLVNTLVVCAAEYATRSPERNPENPFISNPKLVKSLLDNNTLLFEKLYHILGNKNLLSNVLENAKFWYESAFVLPELCKYFPHASSDTSAVRIIDHNFQLPQYLDLEYERSLRENDAYCEKNPDTSYLIDKEQGRIWMKRFENEGRRRAYWLNTDSAPEFFYKLMNDQTLLELVERQANAPAWCESLLCEELSAPLVFHHGRNWHIDKLADQIKLMIPLQEVNDRNGALRWIEGTSPDYLIEKNLPRSHLHHSFIYSAMKTTIANFLPNSVIPESKKLERTTFANKNQLILLNTQCIHSGSLAESGQVRRTLTLTYKVNSLRNNALNSLPCFY